MAHTLKVQKVAELLDTTPQTIRVMMDKEMVKYGYVVKGRQRNKYIIIKELFEKETGICVGE